MSQHYSAPDQFRIAVIGDLHTFWDHVDLAQISGLFYDLLCFVGDLGGGTRESSLAVARNISKLQLPTLVMPGNNDTGDIHELAAELAHQSGIQTLMAMGADDSIKQHSVRLCGYTRHTIEVGARRVALITGRPHSMGGPELSFPDFMQESYGIGSLDESFSKLKELIEHCEEDELLFISHNGPRGLGEEPHDMWGCDFKEGGGDWGDPDLQLAIEYAQSIGKKVLAVIGGHMHLRTKQGAVRSWISEREGVQYVNAARVPRIFNDRDNVFRHHLEMTLTESDLSVKELLLPEY